MKRCKLDRLRFAPLWILLVFCISCHLGSPKVRDASKAESTPQPATTWQPDLPVYDHVVIIVEENKNYGQIIGNPNAPYLNDVLRKEGANLTRMFAEEHFSEGNYFWLFSGSNQRVGFLDRIPDASVDAESLGHELISSGHSFAGYSEGLPSIGSTTPSLGHYARKHVPWIAFSNIPQGTSASYSSNLRFEDFPTDFTKLPTVAFVIPNLIHDMHDGSPAVSVSSGDEWLRMHIDPYYQWAKQHNSLLIITFDEDARARYPGGLTDPASTTPRGQNRIPTLLVGAHIKHGDYEEGKGVNHVTLLRTLEAMYRLKRTGKQQELAEAAGIKDDFVIMDVFDRTTKQ